MRSGHRRPLQAAHSLALGRSHDDDGAPMNATDRRLRDAGRRLRTPPRAPRRPEAALDTLDVRVPPSRLRWIAPLALVAATAAAVVGGARRHPPRRVRPCRAGGHHHAGDRRRPGHERRAGHDGRRRRRVLRRRPRPRVDHRHVDDDHSSTTTTSTTTTAPPSTGQAGVVLGDLLGSGRYRRHRRGARQVRWHVAGRSRRRKLPHPVGLSCAGELRPLARRGRRCPTGTDPRADLGTAPDLETNDAAGTSHAAATTSSRTTFRAAFGQTVEPGTPAPGRSRRPGWSRTRTTGRPKGRHRLRRRARRVRDRRRRGLRRRPGRGLLPEPAGRRRLPGARGSTERLFARRRPLRRRRDAHRHPRRRQRDPSTS